MSEEVKKTVKKTTIRKTTAAKKTTAVRKTAAKKSAPEKKTAAPKKKIDPLTLQVVELCEKTAYDRKAENILRLDMTSCEGAQSDFYLICTGLSEPHIEAVAEYIRREVRNKLGIRPLLCNGTRQSRWIIIDFGYVIVHVLTSDAREKYQLEELWGDAEKLDVIAKLDKEALARRKAEEQA